MPASKGADTQSGFDKSVDRIRDNVKTFAQSVGETAAEGVGTLADQGADGVKAVAGQVPRVSHWIDEQVDSAR